MFLLRLAECLCGKNESAANWNDIASRIKILYDPQFDYHPQYERFVLGTEIKQADTVLIGYPMMFPMNASTRANDLKFYGNATRSSGPAMSCSMYAINYLDIDDEEKANDMLKQSYKPYVRQPFNVWNEVVEDEIGATNFITGAGGFLQTILSGFLGIRLHLDRMEIINPRLPVSCSSLGVKGLSYKNSKFELMVKRNGRFITFFDLRDDFRVTFNDINGKFVTKPIVKNVECKFGFIRD